MLETAFIETELPEAEEESKEDETPEESDLIRIEFVKVLKRTYQQAWIRVLSKVASKKSMIKRTLIDLP